MRCFKLVKHYHESASENVFKKTLGVLCTFSYCANEQYAVRLCSTGEERPADTKGPGGQAVEGSQRSAEGAGRSGDGAGSHAAPDEPDSPESQEPG